MGRGGLHVVVEVAVDVAPAPPPAGDALGKGGEIQLTDALKVLANKEAMFAYNFEGKRYDVGNKQGFLTATVETALRREDLREEFLEYLIRIVESETGKTLD